MEITNKRVIKAVLSLLQKSAVVKKGLKDVDFNEVTDLTIDSVFGPFICVNKGKDTFAFIADTKIDVSTDFETDKLVIMAWEWDTGRDYRYLGTVEVKYTELL